MTKRLTGAVGLLALGLLCSATASARDKVVLVLSTFGSPYMPTLAADELGFFERENIEVEIVRTEGGSKALAAIVGGSAHVLIGSPVSSFRARAKGADTYVIGAAITQYASNVVISADWAKQKGVSAASPYDQKLQALKGATLGVTSVGSGTDQLVRFLAKQAGLNADRDMTITGLGTGETMIAGLVQGRVNGFVVSSPSGEAAVKQHNAVMLFNMSQGEVKALEGFFYIGTIARESWCKENQDLVVRFLRAQQRAHDVMHDPKRTAEARDAVWKKYHSKTEKEFFDFVWDQNLPAWPKTVQIDAGMMARIADFANEFEKQPLPAEAVNGGWSNEYAQNAVASLRAGK